MIIFFAVDVISFECSSGFFFFEEVYDNEIGSRRIYFWLAYFSECVTFRGLDQVIP